MLLIRWTAVMQSRVSARRLSAASASFFPNSDHEILHGKLAESVRCEHALELVRVILASFHTGAGVAAPLFPGDDLADAVARSRGLPIGNLTSQLWGNYALDALDHLVTETQRHGAYLRYTDDFLLFGDDRNRLWELRAGIADELARDAR